MSADGVTPGRKGLLDATKQASRTVCAGDGVIGVRRVFWEGARLSPPRASL